MPLKPSHVFVWKQMADSEWTLVERTWDIKSVRDWLTYYIFTSCVASLLWNIHGQFCAYCVSVYGACANMTPWTLRVKKPCAAGFFTLNVSLRFPAQTSHIFQWAVALKITGACSAPGRLSSDHPFSKRVVIFKSTECLFQHLPHWQTKFNPMLACAAAQALVQRYNSSCPWVWMNLVSLQVAVQTLLGQDDVKLTCFP